MAVRRVRPAGAGESLLDYIDTKRYTLLPNTAGCYNADEAVRTCYLAREAGLGTLVKLEVIGDSRTLFPDTLGLLEATQHAGPGGLQRPALYERRSGHLQEARGRRARRR